MKLIRIALIYPKESYDDYNNHSSKIYQLKGVFPPLNLLYVATVLNNHGHQCIIIDANADNLEISQVINIIKLNNISLIGFSLCASTLSRSLSYICKISEKTKVPIIVGGTETQYFGEKIISENYIDYIMKGSAFDTLNLVNKIQDGKSLQGVNGLIYKKKEKIITNLFRDTKSDFVKIRPDWSLLNKKRYYTPLTSKPYATVVASLGCTFECIFCSDAKSGVLFREVEDVYKEMLDFAQLKKNIEGKQF